MATVNGIIKNASGEVIAGATVEFNPLSTPLAESPAIILSRKLTAMTDEDGLLSIVLEQGDYRVRVLGDGTRIPRDVFIISVPNDEAEYQLAALVSESLTYVYPSEPVSLGSLLLPGRTVTANATINALTDVSIWVGTISAPITVTLPTAAGNAGKVFVVKDAKGTAETHNITVAAQPGQTINGQSTYLIALNWECQMFQSDGAQWLTITLFFI